MGKKEVLDYLSYSEKKKTKLRFKYTKQVKAFFGGLLALTIETLLLLVIALLLIMFLITKGLSPTARDLFVRSVRETSAIGFLANIYLSEEEIKEIETVEKEIEYVETDTSLINVNKVEEENNEEISDEWGLRDDDGDGIIIKSIKGEGYSGYLMVVEDPSRVKLGAIPSSFGKKGYTLEEMILEYGAVAGINAGGFLDPNGTGDGSTPDSLVVIDGKIYYREYGIGNGFVGLDANHIMHVGMLSIEDIKNRNIVTGVCFGPALVINGEPVDPAYLPSGINPRTAIGQRSDGAILMLVIDGRQATSLGAKYQDLADIMYEYGAINACNLDGGSSSLMWFDGKYINTSASVVGIRDMPTSFIVMPKE